MNQKSRIGMKCAHCGCEYDALFPQIVLKDDDPELAQMIIDDTFFYVKCPECQHMENVDIPVMYADMKKQAIICYFGDIIELSNAQSYIEQQIAHFGIDREKSFVRVVYMQNELREKVILLEEGLDDRVVEILKLWALETVRNEGHRQVFEEVRCSVLHGDKLNVDFVGDAPVHISLARSYYNRIANALIPALKKTPTPLEVSTEWAIEFDVNNSQ